MASPRMTTKHLPSFADLLSDSPLPTNIPVSNDTPFACLVMPFDHGAWSYLITTPFTYYNCGAFEPVKPRSLFASLEAVANATVPTASCSKRAARAEADSVKRISDARNAPKSTKSLPTTASEDALSWRQIDAAAMHVANKLMGRMAPSVKAIPVLAVAQGLMSRSQAAVARHINRTKSAGR
jgi:hypothetical protein